jgi:hypothetical protein
MSLAHQIRQTFRSRASAPEVLLGRDRLPRVPGATSVHDRSIWRLFQLRMAGVEVIWTEVKLRLHRTALILDQSASRPDSPKSEAPVC